MTGVGGGVLACLGRPPMHGWDGIIKQGGVLACLGRSA